MHLDILGEFLGTLVLILLGNGVGMSTHLKRMLANQHGKWIMIALGWGLAVLMGVIVAFSLNSPAHLNPAVSIFALVSGSLALWKFFVYFLVQVLGAFIGQVILYIINYKNIKETNDWNLMRAMSATGGVYDNFNEKGLVQNLLYEYVASLVLIGVIFALSKGKNTQAFQSLGTIPVMLLVLSIGLSLGSVSGYAINPARDFGPRLAFWVFSTLVWKQKSASAQWSYSFVPIVSPLLAGTTIGLFALI
ncbi:MIP/aquaporin family protein [Mycoplasmopsis pulmonis]|uniref:MIP/aquaporin family protein n=1 Tax=Mycoplasmopsis pulmonis TaxID=2107 RepID=UPI002ACD3886|nr:MIP/aquaporin family protein [Mycoplasmopsis pulmonis]MDZ7293185.1 aquaporin family protein [Mycoplasmopsis pulmonis]